MNKKLIGLIAAAGLATSASASTIVTDSYGSSAEFDLSGSTLTVTLTSGRNATSFGSVLTAVFFNAGAVATPVSANGPTGAGSLIGTGTLLADYTGNVGGEWEYLGGSDVLAFGARQGISSTGLDIFGSPNFGGPNLFGPVAVDGGQFGIVASEDGANLGLSQSLVTHDSVTFKLTVPSSFSLNSIGNVTLFYGTSLDETNVPDAASTLALLGFGLIATEALRRRLQVKLVKA